MNSDSVTIKLTVVVDHAVPVEVGLADHVVDLLLAEPLAQVRHHVTQLHRRYQTVVVLVEYPGIPGRKSFLMANRSDQTSL